MLEELREAIKIIKECNITYFNTNIGNKYQEAINALLFFAQLILDSKGFPKPMEEKTINLERADDPSYVEGEEWNSCLSLCLAAHVKEKVELIGKIPSVEEMFNIIGNCYTAMEKAKAIHSELMKRLKDE